MEKYIQITGLILYVIVIGLNLIYYYNRVKSYKGLFIFATIIPGINLILLISMRVYHWCEDRTFKKMQLSEREKETPAE